MGNSGAVAPAPRSDRKKRLCIAIVQSGHALQCKQIKENDPLSRVVLVIPTSPGQNPNLSLKSGFFLTTTCCGQTANARDQQPACGRKRNNVRRRRSHNGTRAHVYKRTVDALGEIEVVVT